MEMQYCLSFCKLLNSIGTKYKGVGGADPGLLMAVCQCGIHIVLSNIYIDPPETCRDAMLSFHLQITREH